MDNTLCPSSVDGFLLLEMSADSYESTQFMVSESYGGILDILSQTNEGGIFNYD